MAEKYEIVKSQFSVRELLEVPHKKKQILYISSPPFGPYICFSHNREGMRKQSYLHPQTGKRISFREPTTAESISAAAWEFGERAKLEIFDPRRPARWLHLGYIVWTSEGFFANPPKTEKGNPVIGEKALKSFLDKSKKVNGIWLYEDKDARDFGFAPYETFERGIIQEAGKFAEGGLARVLEHTEEKEAKNLKVIASPEFYKKGVYVCGGHGKVKDPVLRTVNMFSGKADSDRGELIVDCTWGNDYYDLFGQKWDDNDGGYVFGVLEELNNSS